MNGGKVHGGGQICKPETITMGTTLLTDERHQQPMMKGLSVPKLRGVIMELAGDDGDITFPTTGEMEADGLVVMDGMKQLAGKTFKKQCAKPARPSEPDCARCRAVGSLGLTADGRRAAQGLSAGWLR